MSQNAADYVMLPWSIRGPLRRDEKGKTRYEMFIDELPEFLVSAETEGGVLYEFKRALRSFLEAALQRGADVPRPNGPPVRYATPPRSQVPRARVFSGHITVASVKL
jgi:hypothetical protein